jgi:hypothetical protein
VACSIWITLIFGLFVSGAAVILAVMAGSIIGVVLAGIFFLLNLWYVYVVRHKIPFAAAMLNGQAISLAHTECGMRFGRGEQCAGSIELTALGAALLCCSSVYSVSAIDVDVQIELVAADLGHDSDVRPGVRLERVRNEHRVRSGQWQFRWTPQRPWTHLLHPRPLIVLDNFDD